MAKGAKKGTTPVDIGIADADVADCPRFGQVAKSLIEWLRGVGARCSDVLGRGVDARHACAKPGERFAQQARAAADIERGQAFERAA